MPQQTKVFRVFVSSTFTDMKLERYILQRITFPKLERFCEANGARFQAVDLRFGVSAESQMDQKTLQICLNEIERCQKISPKPNFIILLGEKYGWQPIPEIIPEDEMMQILNTLPDDKRKLVNRWYLNDQNAVPPEFILQPRNDELREYSSWEPIEKELRNLLRNSVEELNFRPEKKIKYFASATHQEIIKGALDLPKEIESPDRHVFAFSRTIKRMPYDKSAKGFIDLNDEGPDLKSGKEIEALKSHLKERLGEGHFVEYQGEWKNGTLFIDNRDLLKFGDDVYNKLEAIIKVQLKETIDKDELLYEIKLHNKFKAQLTEHFYGRNETLRQLQDYLYTNSENSICVLTGNSGSGKSSVMAEFVNEIEAGMKDAVIVTRFIGTTSRSTNIISLLESVCRQVAGSFDTTIEALAGEGREKSLHDINGMSEIFKECLTLGRRDKPVFIFLDALDQLSETDNALSFYWIPQTLPENSKMVVSVISDHNTRLGSHKDIDLPVLPEKEASVILNRWLSVAKRTLLTEQKNELLDKFKVTGLPLFLKLAFEQAKKWNSYMEKSDCELPYDVNGIINKFINLLEKEHNMDFVRDVICLMLCGRYQGLAENEILEIFAFDEGLWNQFLERTHEDHRDELRQMKEMMKKKKKWMKLPVAVWSRLYLDLEPYLTERDADGVPIITFFHRKFNEVLRERYGL